MVTNRDDFVIAIRSAFLNKGTQQRFSLLGLIIFSLIFLILGSFNFKVVDYVKIGIKEIVYRSSFIVSGPENLIKNSFTNLNNHFSHYKDYKKIKYELNELKSKDLTKEIINLENIKLKKLIDDYFIADNEIFAKVLIDKKSKFLKSVVLNKGSKHNIKQGMAVLDGIYLVGKVVEVNYLTSRVLLLSDLNAKIPVTLEPGDTQAIMSGTGKESGSLQYIKNTYSNSKQNNEDLMVFTSGAGALFKGGIPIGKIKNNNQLKSSKDDFTNQDVIVDFYVDFSQLKYVKVLSFSKETLGLTKPIKNELKEIDNKITIIKNAETLKILLEEKKISDETRIKIESENEQLKSNAIKLTNEISKLKAISEKINKKSKDLEFLELNLLYGSKCKKNFYNNLYKVGTVAYRNCVLNKAKIKKN